MKQYLFISALAVMISFSSCSKDGYNEITRTIGAPAITLITSNSDGSVSVIPGTYSFSITMTDTETTGSVTSPEIIANNTSLAFSTDVQTYKSSGYDVFFENAHGTVGNSSMELNNANFQALYLYDKEFNKYNGFYFNTAEVGKYTFAISNYSNLYMTLASYNLGSAYSARTFPVDCFFVGNTTTTYPQSDTPYNTDKIMYRVMMKQDKETGKFSADMLLYDAKFSGVPAEPTKVAILVPNLNVEFSATGVSISGENVVPSVYESGEYVPNETYVFNNIRFTTTNSLYTEATIDYTVMGVFHGYFSGSYCVSSYMK